MQPVTEKPKKVFYKAPTFDLDLNTWSETSFEKRKDALSFIRSHIKYPGQYNLKYTQGVWNEQACIFQKNERVSGNGHYPIYVNNSVDFRNHWDFEESKCLFEGFIIYKKPSEGLEFAVPCLYYWYLNYCPIPDKVKQREDFPEIYDGDLHYFLYILECILVREFGVVLKKRQSGYTLKNMAIKLNAIWFGRSAMSKIFAFDENKVKESWAFMTNYRDHNNRYCAWKRGFDPSKPLDWHMRRKQTDGSYIGRNCQAKGFTTKQNFSNGIGGSAKVIFGEESGANPTLGKTHEFITSNVSYGGLTTGLIIYSGAVGELDQAEPLKEFILHPKRNGFVSRPNNIPEDIELGSDVGFFAPEWWNYVSVERDEDDKPVGEALRCFDENGNSDEVKSKAEIAKWRAIAKEKDPEGYRYYCSQRPLSITEAFAFRKEAKFPQNLVQAQKRRIEDRLYTKEFVDIVQDEKGALVFARSTNLPISDFPISKTAVNKEGCIVISERPIGYETGVRPELGKYYVASIDPTDAGKTTTSESLFCILIYKLDVEVTVRGEESQTFIEPGKIVCEWTGRFDDPIKTNERARDLLEIYGATATVEVNISSFVNYMIGQRKQHYLVPKSQLLFLKELGSNLNAFQDYGWKNTGSLFEKHLIPYIIEFMKEELDRETKEDGTVVKIVHGVERLNVFIMIIKEMELYQPGMNVDRLIALGGLVAYVKVLLANRGYAKRIDYVDAKYKTDDSNLYAKPRSFFVERGKKSQNDMYNVKKSFFRNIKK